MFNSFAPIFIHTRSSQPCKCPNCQKDEEIKQVCAHCGHEYEEEESGSGWEALKLILSIAVPAVLFSFLIVSLTEWYDDCYPYSKYDKPYTGTYIQWMKEAMVNFWNGFLKRLW